MGVALEPMISANAIQITPEILSLIAGVDEFKGAWPVSYTHLDVYKRQAYGLQPGNPH